MLCSPVLGYEIQNNAKKDTIARVNLQNKVGLTLSVAYAYFPKTLNFNTKNTRSA